MLQDAASFAEAVRPLIEKLVKEQTRNVLRADRFDVVTPADGSKMGVRQPFGKREIFLPYTQEVANAQQGDAVLVLWRGSLSNGKVWCFGNGPEGAISNFVTPEMYGAKGNGVSDDTAALQACLVNGNNVILSGTYLITEPLDIANKHDIIIFGGTIVRNADQTFNTLVGSGCDNITIENVTFDGNGNNREMTYTWKDNVQACMILASQSKNIRVINCRIYNYNYGVFINGADVLNEESSFQNTALNGVIQNCVFHNCHSAVDTYGKSVLIDHNSFYGNTGKCVQVEANYTSQGEENPMDDQNYYTSVVGAVVSNNTFIDNADTDVVIHHNAYGTIVEGNTFLNYYRAITAINDDGSRGISIFGNVLMYQKRQQITSDKRPWSYFASIDTIGTGVVIDGNSIYSPVVGIYEKGNSEIRDNVISKPQISGIVVYDNSTISGMTVIRGNRITDHTIADGAYWGCYAVVFGNTISTYYFLDNLVESTSRPVYMFSGAEAFVKNLISNQESSAITKPSGIYEYSN